MLLSENNLQILERVPNVPAVQWVVLQWQLRAFIENPLGNQPDEPAYLLCEVEEADKETRIAHLRVVGTPYTFFQRFENIKCVHVYIPSLNKVHKILGDVK